jgi:hypothetical protein
MIQGSPRRALRPRSARSHNAPKAKDGRSRHVPRLCPDNESALGSLYLDDNALHAFIIPQVRSRGVTPRPRAHSVAWLRSGWYGDLNHPIGVSRATPTRARCDGRVKGRACSSRRCVDPCDAEFVLRRVDDETRSFAITYPSGGSSGGDRSQHFRLLRAERVANEVRRRLEHRARRVSDDEVKGSLNRLDTALPRCRRYGRRGDW